VRARFGRAAQLLQRHRQIEVRFRVARVDRQRVAVRGAVFETV